MEKVIRIDVADSYLEVTQEDQGQWWETNGIHLPKNPALRCNGIWEDDASFDCAPADTTYRMDLKMPTQLLVSLITKTRELVQDPDTSWWNNHQDILLQLRDALGISTTPTPKTKRRAR